MLGNLTQHLLMHLIMPYCCILNGNCCYISLIEFFPLDFPNLDFGDIPMVAVQDLSNILKQGYLEKKRRGKTRKPCLSHRGKIMDICVVYAFICCICFNKYFAFIYKIIVSSAWSGRKDGVF